ncbi:MAG: response regulator [Nitrospirae bacterium]|nr:response regulator [Nitrospirota bacterium]
MRRIMVIDDDPQIVDMLKQFLLARNYDAVGYDRALDGIRALADVKVDAIITDIVMPGMDGIEFLRAVRNVAPEIPVLLITAFPKMDFVRKALEHGAVDFLSKPLNLIQLEQAVKKMLERTDVPETAKLSWKEKRLSKKIHKRMQEKEIRNLEVLARIKWKLWDATEDFRKHPVFYLGAVLLSASLLWVVAEVTQRASAARQDPNSLPSLLRRAVEALEKDNELDSTRPR